jgi:hypothetical protein
VRLGGIATSLGPGADPTKSHAENIEAMRRAGYDTGSAGASTMRGALKSYAEHASNHVGLWLSNPHPTTRAACLLAATRAGSATGAGGAAGGSPYFDGTMGGSRLPETGESHATRSDARSLGAFTSTRTPYTSTMRIATPGVNETPSE